MNSSAKKGFTLVELLVYVLISSIVILISGRIWWDSTRQSYDTRGLLNASSDIDEVFLYLNEDLSRTGAKVSMTSGSTDSTNHHAYWNLSVGDSSSFSLRDNGDLDTIVFKASNYYSDGTMSTYDSVAYFVNADGEMIRSVTTRNIADSTDSATWSTKIMGNITEFSIRAGIYNPAGDSNIYIDTSMVSGAQDLYVDDASLSFSDSIGDTVHMFVSGFDSAVTHTIKINPGHMPAQEMTVNGGLKASETYAVEFYTRVNADMDTTFIDTADVMELDVVTSGGSAIDGIPKLKFYPGGADQCFHRYFEFSPTNDVADPRLRFVINIGHADNGPEQLFIDRFRLYQVNQGYYSWETAFAETASDTADLRKKRNTKAFEVTIKVNKGTRMFQGADSTLSREYKKIIKVLNNGI